MNVTSEPLFDSALTLGSDNRTGVTASPTSNGSVSPPAFIEYTVERVLATYLLPLIIAVGTVGNLLSLAVLLRRRMRRTSVYLYLIALAVADLSVLYLMAFKTWIRLVGSMPIFLASPLASC